MASKSMEKPGGKPREFRLDPQKAEAFARLLRHCLSKCPPGSIERLSEVAREPAQSFRLIRELAALKDVPCVVSDEVFLDALKINRPFACNGQCQDADARKEERPFMPFYDDYPELEPKVKRALLIVKNGRGHVLFNVRTSDTEVDDALIRTVLCGMDMPRPRIIHINSRRGPYYQISLCNVRQEALLDAVENVEAAAIAFMARKELVQCPREESARLARDLGMEPDD